MPDYEVYALKYGERDTKTCQFFYRDEEHAPLTLHYFVWLIMGGPHPVLVWLRGGGGCLRVPDRRGTTLGVGPSRS